MNPFNRSAEMSPELQFPARMITRYNPTNGLQSADLSILKSLDETFKIKDTYTEKSVIDYFDEILAQFSENEDNCGKKDADSVNTICLKKVKNKGQDVEIHLGMSEKPMETPIRSLIGEKHSTAELNHATSQQNIGRMNHASPARKFLKNVEARVGEVNRSRKQLVKKSKRGEGSDIALEQATHDQSDVIIELITANSDRPPAEIRNPPTKSREKRSSMKNNGNRHSFSHHDVTPSKTRNIKERPRSADFTIELLKTSNKSGTKTELRKTYSQQLSPVNEKLPPLRVASSSLTKDAKSVNANQSNSTSRVLPSSGNHSSANTSSNNLVSPWIANVSSSNASVSPSNATVSSSNTFVPPSNKSIPSTNSDSFILPPVEIKRSSAANRIDVISSFGKNILKFPKEKKISADSRPSLDSIPERKVSINRTVRGFDAFILY